MILNKKMNNNKLHLMLKSDSQYIESYITELNYGDYILLDVGPHMRLDKLAKKYYNDTSLWWIIAKINGINNFSLFIGQNYNFDKILIPLKNIKSLQLNLVNDYTE